MSLEQNIDLRPSPAYRDIPAGNQLVPYCPGKNQVIPYTPKSSPMRSLSGEPATRRFAIIPPPLYPDNKNQLGIAESAYNSSRRLVAPKMNQIGLLINIYA